MQAPFESQVEHNGLTGSQIPSDALMNLNEHFVQIPLIYSAQFGAYN
jgi:hypothetical protein